MKKVVINQRCGGFTLSDKAIELLLEKQGKPVHRIPMEGHFLYDPAIYSKVPLPENWDSQYIIDHLRAEDVFQWMSNNKYFQHILTNDRTNPDLIAVVEELGEEANGKYAELTVIEPTGPYIINENDGSESLQYRDDTDWVTE